MKKDIQKELEELSPLLAKLERKNNFDLPSNYFEGLADSVLEQVQERDTTDSTSFFYKIESYLSQLFRPRLAVAFAGVCLFFVASYFLIPTSINDHSEKLLTQLNPEDIQQYIIENVADFEDTILFEWSKEEDLSFDFLEDALDNSDLDEMMDSILDDLDSETLEEML